MAAFAWAMIGLALWHFTIFLPDRFWAGIVGAFIGALVGSILGGLVLHGFDLPAREDMTIVTALEGIPGAVLGMGLIWVIGSRQEREASIHSV